MRMSDLRELITRGMKLILSFYLCFNLVWLDYVFILFYFGLFMCFIWFLDCKPYDFPCYYFLVVFLSHWIFIMLSLSSTNRSRGLMSNYREAWKKIRWRVWHFKSREIWANLWVYTLKYGKETFMTWVECVIEHRSYLLFSSDNFTYLHNDNVVTLSPHRDSPFNSDVFSFISRHHVVVLPFPQGDEITCLFSLTGADMPKSTYLVHDLIP